MMTSTPRNYPIDACASRSSIDEPSLLPWSTKSALSLSPIRVRKNLTCIVYEREALYVATLVRVCALGEHTERPNNLFQRCLPVRTKHIVAVALLVSGTTHAYTYG